MKVEIILVVNWREKNREKGGRGRVFVISCFVEDIDYNVMLQTMTKMRCLGGKGAKKKNEKVIRKKSSKVWCYRKEKKNFYLFYILIFFRVGWSSQGMVKSDKTLGVVLYDLFWKWLQIQMVCGIFCNV